jgi:hypothetical protein
MLVAVVVLCACGSSGATSRAVRCQEEALSGPEPAIRTSLDVTVRSLGVDQQGNLRLEARSTVPLMTQEVEWRAWPGIASYLLRARRTTYTLRFREPDGCVVQVAGNSPNGLNVLDAASNLTLRAAPSPAASAVSATTVRRLLRAAGIPTGSVVVVRDPAIGAYAFAEVNQAVFAHLDNKMPRIARVLNPRLLPLGLMLMNHYADGAGEMNIGGLSTSG